MSFLETVERARALLERHRRISLRALGRELGLDPEALAELSEELVLVQRVAVREAEVLVWASEEPSKAQPPDPRPPLPDSRYPIPDP